MGNNPPENERFNSNFNMAEYNQRLNQVTHQYHNNPNINAPGAYYGNRPQAQTMNCQQVTRSVYIFKTTIQIHIDNSGNLNLQFFYHCVKPSTFDLAIGVTRIEQNQHTKQTTNVECLKSFREMLAAAEKNKFSKTYPIQASKIQALFQNGIMMKISSENQSSQYSLTYIKNTKLWKVCVQNFKRDNQIFGIEDIYGGGQQGQQCIICFSETSSTLIKPCNHLCLCGQCAKIVQKQSNNCPICRKKILSLVALSTNK